MAKRLLWLPLLFLTFASNLCAGIEDRDNRDATAAGWAANITLSTMQAIINQGNRVVELEVTSTSPTTLVTIAYVPNKGSFQRTWWWAVNYTPSSLATLVSNNKARITDLEVYTVSGSVRMAALMELNTSTNAKGWWWYYGTTVNYIYTQAGSLGARIVDLEKYTVGTSTYYAGVLLKNSGSDARSWWTYLNITSSQLETYLATNKARIWDIDRVGSGRYDVTMVKFAGEYSWHFYGLTATGVTDKLSQYGGRLTDIEQYSTLVGTRFDIVFTNSSNALSRRVCDLMLSKSDGFMGTYLRRVGTSTSWDLAYVHGDKRFEPASTLKTLHLARAMKEVQTSSAFSLSTSMTVNTTTSKTNSCPFSTTPYTSPLQTVLQGMMRASDNAMTKVIGDRYGLSSLTSYGSSTLGMKNTAVNHHIGCGSPANYTTLVDMGKLHEAVIRGHLGSERENFYKIFASGFYGTNGYYAESYLTPVIDQEAAKVGLTSTQKGTFLANMRVLGKKGGYSVSSGYHRAWAAYASIPFWTNGGMTQREYVTGAFVNNASNETKAIDCAATGAAEVLRDEIRSGMQSLKNHVFGSLSSFGSSCKGSLSTGYVHTATGTPEIGQKLTYKASASRRATTTGMLYIGGSKTYWGRAPLPVHLAFMYAPGCYLQVSPDIAIALPCVAGVCQLTAALPTDTGLIGLSFHTQFLIADPGANTANVVATNGVTTTIGGQK